jgi:hypothetical protein
MEEKLELQLEAKKVIQVQLVLQDLLLMMLEKH